MCCCNQSFCLCVVKLAFREPSHGDYVLPTIGSFLAPASSRSPLVRTCELTARICATAGLNWLRWFSCRSLDALIFLARGFESPLLCPLFCPEMWKRCWKSLITFCFRCFWPFQIKVTAHWKTTTIQYSSTKGINCYGIFCPWKQPKEMMFIKKAYIYFAIFFWFFFFKFLERQLLIYSNNAHIRMMQ